MWGRHRKALIIAILVAVGVFLVAVTGIATFYHAPSCNDDKQNQGETGVDCGGPCSHLCTPDELAPEVLFAHALTQQPGRTDVVAQIINKNGDAAAKDVPFTVTLYAADGVQLASKVGTVDLPPGATVPVFIPGAYTGISPVKQAFLTIDPNGVYWYRYKDDRVQVPVSNIALTQSGQPRVTATVTNTTAFPILNLPVIITLFDSNNNALAASRTVVSTIPPMGDAQIVFTWNAPFTVEPAREEVTPLVPLPTVGLRLP